MFATFYAMILVLIFASYVSEASVNLKLVSIFLCILVFYFATRLSFVFSALITLIKNQSNFFTRALLILVPYNSVYSVMKFETWPSSSVGRAED